MPPKPRAGDEQHFFRFAEAHAFAEHREVQRLDAREQRAISMHQKPQGAAAIGIDQTEKRGAFFVQLPGAIGFEAQQVRERRAWLRSRPKSSGETP